MTKDGRLGLEGAGGGVCILKIVIAKEGYNFYMIHLLPAPPTHNKRTVPKHEITLTPVHPLTSQGTDPQCVNKA